MDKFLINLVNDSDFEKIRRLRNSQKNVLRNNFQLSKLDQNLYKKNYFKNFSKKPTEILFSLNINKNLLAMVD